MSKISINLLDEVGGNIVTDEFAFPSVDAYSGDIAERAVRIYPTIPGSTVKNVKMNFSVMIDGNSYQFKPENPLSDSLKSAHIDGITFEVLDENNFKKKSDINGMYNLGTFSSPKDLIIRLKVSSQTVTDHSQDKIWDNLMIGVYHA